MTEQTAADVLRDRVRTDLRSAMKAQRRDEMAVLRMLIAAIDNAESVEDLGPSPAHATSEHVAGAAAGIGATEGTRRRLSEHDVQVVVETEESDRRQQADALESLGRAQEASRLRMEADVIARYRTLPTDD